MYFITEIDNLDEFQGLGYSNSGMKLLPNKTFRSLFSSGKIIIFILAVGFVVRVTGLNFGLPFLYHVDEARFADISLNYFTGDFNPHFFHVPSLHTYLVAGLWGIYYFIGKLFGNFSDISSFMEFFRTDPTSFILIARSLSVLLSLGTILLLFILGKKMYNTRVGLTAALFLIFSHVHNKISHYSVPDVPMVFFLVLTFYFIWKIYREGKPSSYLLAGLSAGLATSMKYGGQLLYIPLILSHFFYGLKNKKSLKSLIFSWPLLISGVVFLAAFLAGSPFALLDFQKFWNDFRWQSQHLFTEGHYGSSTSYPAWLFYLFFGFRENIGPISQLLIPLGLILFLLRPSKKEIILLSYPLLLFVLVGTWKAKAVRYILPLTPFLILFSAWTLDAVSQKIEKFLVIHSKKISILSKAIFPVLLIFCLVHPLYKTIRFDYSLTQKDTRTLAKEWIENNIPINSKIALEMYCPPLSEKDYELHYRHTLGNVKLEFLAARGVEYIVISDIMYSRFTDSPEEFPAQASFYKSLDEMTIPVKTFIPSWNEELIDLHNPTIKIYRLSSLANYKFPGNFKQYAQVLSLTRMRGGRWELQSRLKYRKRLGEQERVCNPYLKLLNPKKKEPILLPLYRGEIKEEESNLLETTHFLDEILPETQLILGYEYTLDPKPSFVESEGPFRKEYTFADIIDEDALQRKEMHFIFFYTQSPQQNEDEYFQIITLTKTKKMWKFFSHIFGGELRWGNDYVKNPAAFISDAKGKKIAKLLIYEGKVGSENADKKAPAKKSMGIEEIPDEFDVYAGYEFYYDSDYPEKAGGPVFLSLPVIPLNLKRNSAR